MISEALALALLLVQELSSGANGGDLARQSPCVFETVFPASEPAKWKRIKTMENFAPGTPLGLAEWPRTLGKETSIPEWYALGKLTCDGISLREEVKHKGTVWEEPGLRLSEVHHPPNGKYELTLEATLYNPLGNGDRLVAMTYDVMDENGVVIQTATRSYKLVAKAKSGENADVVILFTPDQLRRVKRLRLTMTTTPY